MLLSEWLYNGLCESVGLPQTIANRREIMDTLEALFGSNPHKILPTLVILSGSRREGFRFDNSDVDVMVCLQNYKVVWNYSQFSNCSEHIMFNGTESPPGYGSLQTTPSQDRALSDFIITSKKKSYLSSIALKTAFCSGSPQFQINGPCASWRSEHFAMDIVYSIASAYWPPDASSFAKRCNLWPKPDLVQDIVKSGCHVVPTGPTSDNEDLIWRISFSLAERKILNNMNHFQFLCYGLLKIFLNEAINRCSEEDKILKSYHIKTAVFWVLQQKSLPECCPRNLLKYFKICLKLLIKWVDEGNCPNFFIPENNMFRNKIYGSIQQELLQKLHKLYEKTPWGILEICPSLYECVSSSFTNDIPTLTKTCTSLMIVDLFVELEKINMPVILSGNLENYLRSLRKIEQYVGSNMSEIEIYVVKKATTVVLENIAFFLSSVITDINRSFYVLDKIACRALRLAAKFGNFSDMLFGAMYFYSTFRYQKALSILDIVRGVLTEEDTMNTGIERYIETLAGNKSVFVVKLDNELYYIDELVIEQELEEYPWGFLFIPSYVLLLMLEYLCQRHLDTKKATAALNKLFVVVHCDQGKYIFKDLQDISWQILGICQELSDELLGALKAYRKSLDCDKQTRVFNKLESASKVRIQRVENLLYRNTATNS